MGIETDKWICLIVLAMFSFGAFYGLKIGNSDMTSYASHSAELFSGALLTLMLNRKAPTVPDPPADTLKEKTN